MSGVDCSARLDGAAAAEAGLAFAMRYLSGIPGPKITSAAECADLHAHGIAVGLVFENYALDTAGGAEAGVHNAAIAVYEAGVIGCPPFSGVVIYQACDTPTPPVATRDYLTAGGPLLQRQGYARGFYGNPDAGRAFLAAGLVDAVWGVETWGSRDLTSCAIVQRVRAPVTVGGVACDTDDLLGPAAGLWVPAHPPCLAR